MSVQCNVDVVIELVVDVDVDVGCRSRRSRRVRLALLLRLFHEALTAQRLLLDVVAALVVAVAVVCTSSLGDDEGRWCQPLLFVVLDVMLMFVLGSTLVVASVVIGVRRFDGDQAALVHRLLVGRRRRLVELADAVGVGAKDARANLGHLGKLHVLYWIDGGRRRLRLRLRLYERREAHVLRCHCSVVGERLLAAYRYRCRDRSGGGRQ